MSLIDNLKRLFGATKPALRREFDPELFVYIFVPEPIQPLDRGDKYEDPLAEALTTAGLGDVSGGGSSLSDERPDGTRVVESCGIDVDVTDLDLALELIRERIPALGAPRGTELQYTRRGAKLRDVLEENGWVTSLARTAVHPGFGV